jgi:hypothetical protein
MGALENEHIYGIGIRESANDGSDFSNPDADYRVLFLGEDGLIHVKDSAGAVTSPYSAGGTDPTYASWTPTLTADGGNPNIGSTGTATGRYTQHGDMVHAYGRILFAGAGVNAGSGVYEVALPVTAAASSGSSPTALGSALLFDASTSTFTTAVAYSLDTGECRIIVSAATNFQVTNAVPWTWVADDAIILTLVYEAA